MIYQDTIVAQATPPGRGGVAIIRISGPKVKNISTIILKKLPKPRIATFSHFYTEQDEILDEGLALYFAAPHSFTGEDILELHSHGGQVLVDCIIRCILNLEARLARPGEFSERAFLNNKIDLTQAEAIADLIDATSQQAVRSAVRSLQGEFSKKIHQLVDKMIHLRMYVEAAIDFAEEEINFLNNQKIVEDLQKILDELVLIQSNAAQGSLLRDGITAVIAGQPNVGKSSLLNRLSGKDSAIVTEIPGTTRDILREYILIDGMPMHILDTAGLRDSTDIVEQEGIRRAHHEIARADIVLEVRDATSQAPLAGVPTPAGIPIIIIHNKIDLLGESPSITHHSDQTIISLSAKQDTGIDLLKDHIKSCSGFQSTMEGCFSARRRHLDALARAHRFIEKGLQHKSLGAGELLAEDLRQAQHALNEITGEFTTDDLLGKIFSSFCVGK